MNTNQFPLLDLFIRLRENGLSLGIDEYLTVLRALSAGFGIEDRMALEQLCRVVWIKSDDEGRLLHRLFEQIWNQPVVEDDKSNFSKRDSSEPKPVINLPKNTTPPLPVRPPSNAAVADKQSQVEEVAEQDVASGVSTLDLQTDTFNPDQGVFELPLFVQTILHYLPDNLIIEDHPFRFNFSNEYFPVTRRQMKQSWRHLRRLVREGPREELDVAATVEKVSHQGLLLEPVLIPHRINRTQLLLLIDRDGSMAPFHALTPSIS